MAATDSRFPKLPGDGRQGARLCGVEVEFAGLTEERTAALVIETLGGTVRPDGAHAFRVEGTRIGTVKVELDTVLRKTGLPGMEAGLDIARAVVPVEIVSDPLDQDGLVLLDGFRDRLRGEGAIGSRDGVFLGFGVHLNPETPVEPGHRLRIIQAYALLEDWLRHADPIDTTRRILPFVDPWPRKLCDAMIAARDADLGTLMQLYAEQTGSRNHGLDLLPVFKDAAPEAFGKAFPRDRATSARPAFHYRLPDCRIDEPDWSLAHPWRSWMLVERLAEDRALLDRLAEARSAYRHQLFAGRAGWAEIVTDILGKDAEALA